MNGSEQLRADRDHWRQRAEALEAALHDVVMFWRPVVRSMETRGDYVSDQSMQFLAQDCLEMIRKSEALATPAPPQAAKPKVPPCPGYVPTGHACEHCGQSPQDHPAERRA
jgi:hypothetical protein